MVPKELYLRCSCYAPEHIIRVMEFHWDEGQSDVVLEILLYNWQSLWRRMWNAFKYVFKVGRNDTHFDATMLDLETTIKLRDFLSQYIESQGKTH